MNKILVVTRQNIEESVSKIEEKYGDADIISHYYTFSNADTLLDMYNDLKRNKMFVSLDDIPLDVVNKLIAKGVNVSYI